MSRDVWTKKRADATGDNGWSERGGYMAAKVSKLEEQFKSDAPREKQKDGSSSIFTGVAIYVNGYTEPSADELRRLMMMHGGQFHVYYSHSKTTHIIANNLPNSKIQALKGEKVIKPGWITDSIKAGRLLPYLHYQLYAKYKGPLFPAAKPRQTSETAGPSGTRRSIPNQESSNSSSPAHKQQGSLQTIPSPQPRHSPSASSHPGPEHSHFSVRPRHGGGSNSHNPRLKASPLNHPQSGVLPPYRLPPQRTDHPEPQTSSGAHQRRHKEVEIRVNGSLQTSAAALTPECIDAPSPLTNGHAHLFNGALKSKDLVLDQICVPTDPSEWGIASPERKDTSPSRLDPYEFPNSPPKQSDHLPVCPEDSCWKDALRSPQPTSLEVDTNPDKIPRSPSPHRHVPVRLNGSHHDAFSSHPASESNSTVRPLPGEAPSESAARLSAQTGGLISEYYAHSRLHQISTWRTGFSEYVNELHSKRKATGVASFPGKERLRKLVAQGAFESRATPTSFAVKSSIFHVDMDCFFVSVGIRHRPELKDKPVAVTSNRGHMRVPLRPGADPHLEQQYFQRKHALPPPGKDLACLRDAAPRESAEVHVNGVDRDASLSMAEIASCSYAARQAGVKNGMFFGQAKQLCPTLQSVPYDFDAYKEVAVTMYETLASYTHDIEALSCDEVLLDASALVAELCVDPEDLAKVIRADIKEKTGCCASIGMGSNILLARLSTRKAKPDGQYFLKSEEVDDFIRDLPVTSLPGVGPVMGRKLAAIGVKSCGDLRQVSLTQLQKKFGPRSGQTLFRFCRGLDDRPVRYEKERKSVSAEMNYNIRFKKVDEAESFLSNLSMEVQRRLQEAGLQGRRVTLKVMVRKDGAPQETSKYGGHGICDNFAKTVMLAQSTDSGQLIAATVIKMFHAMKLPVQDLRGLGIQVQLLEGSHSARNNANALRTRSIKEMLLGRTSTGKEAGDNSKDHEKTPPTRAISPGSIKDPQSPNVSVPGTSKEHEPCRQTPVTPRTSLDFSIEIPSPSQVDRSVLEALPAELRLQVEQSWTCREGRRTNHHRPASPHPRSPKSRPVSPPCPAPPLNNQLVPSGALVLQIPNQPDSPGIILELPNYSQVDPDVFAALPKELQEELKSAYNHAANNQPQTKMSEQNNALLQLKQSVGVGRLKRRYKRKNAVSPAKKGPSPQKKCRPMNSPAKIGPPFTKLKEPVNLLKAENDPSTSSPKQELLPKGLLRPTPALAGASELPDIKTLLREWVTTMTDPMEEDILQVVKYCTDLIEDKDLEKLDLIIKFMKRIMQQSLESVWSMAFDFILDNVQVVVQQTYGSTLKIT